MFTSSGSDQQGIGGSCGRLSSQTHAGSIGDEAIGRSRPMIDEGEVGKWDGMGWMEGRMN